MKLPVNKQSGIFLALSFGHHHSELCPHVASSQGILWFAEVGKSGEGAEKRGHLQCHQAFLSLPLALSYQIGPLIFVLLC